MAYDARNQVDIQARVLVRVSSADANCEEGGRKIFRTYSARGEAKDYDVTDHAVRFETTVGRVIFNRQCLPADYPYMNYKMVKGDVSALVNDCCDRYSTAEVEPILDAIKHSGFHYATRAGLTISVWDAAIPDDKPALLEDAQAKVDQINEYYEDGFLSGEGAPRRGHQRLDRVHRHPGLQDA